MDSYVTITAHYLTEDWQLQSHVLQTRAVHKSHTRANIAHLLQNAAQETKLTKHLVVVTDNTSDISVAIQLVG